MRKALQFPHWVRPWNYIPETDLKMNGVEYLFICLMSTLIFFLNEISIQIFSYLIKFTILNV